MDCELDLAILPNKVQYLAMTLFGAHVEVNGLLRYIVNENGRKTIPQPLLSVQGVDIGVISQLVSPSLVLGINQSTQRLEEVRQAIHLTDCVGMRVSQSAEECAHLYFIIGLNAGFAVYSECYA